MNTPDPRVLMIEALIDGELDATEKSTIEGMIQNSIELRLLYDVLRKQKHIIKCAYTMLPQQH